MKTKFITITAIAALFAASCSQADLQPSDKAGENVDVSFVAEAPEAIATKAFSDGNTAKNLYYAVYAEDSKTVLIQGSTTFTDRKATVNLTLVMKKRYDIIFWAQNTNAPYDFDMATQTVTADYSAALANNEVLDAFYCTVDSYEVDGQDTPPIHLRRPFAQINVGTNDTGLASKAGYTATHTDMTLADFPNKLNLHTGQVSGEALVEFGKAAIPTGQAFPVTSGSYDYLAMNYVLAPADGTTATVAFTIYGENAIPFSITNVPLKRNYRTNIYGALLTNPTVWNVEIKPAYETPDYNEEQ